MSRCGDESIFQTGRGSRGWRRAVCTVIGRPMSLLKCGLKCYSNAVKRLIVDRLKMFTATVWYRADRVFRCSGSWRPRSRSVQGRQTISSRAGLPRVLDVLFE